MAIDLDAIRKKLNALQSSTNKTSNLWRPEPGKNQIRIVPYQYNKDNPFSELLFHYNVGKRNYLSPMTYGEADPVLEFADQLRNTGNSDDFKLAKKLTPKMRIYVPVIVRGNEGEGVKYWGFGKQVYQELLQFIADPDYGDITDLKAGRDIVINFTPGDGPGNYSKTAILVKPNQTPATEDSNVADKILNGQVDLFDIYKKRSYDELKTILSDWLNGDEGEQSMGQPTTSNQQQAATAGVSSTDDIDKAFDDLFDQ